MQYNITVPNGTGLDVRTNLNLAHQSLATNFFGATDPSTLTPSCSFPFSKWADTGNGLLKIRNNDDTAWITIGTVDADGTPKLTGNGVNLTASDIANTPNGAITSVTVQNAINELGFMLRKNSTAYVVGDVALSTSLPSSLVLECTTAGTTDATEPDFTGATEGGTVTDGTVTWTYKELLSGTQNGEREPSTAYQLEDIAYLSSLPTGWFLTCTTAGTTDAGDLTIATPTVGDTVTDGTVTWIIGSVASDSANRQLSNLDTANLVVHVVVDSYYDSATGDWYRVYDDGWVEQGNLNLLSGAKTVTLLKPYNSANYTITSGSYITYNAFRVNSISSTSFTTDSGVNSLGWVAFGMGASA